MKEINPSDSTERFDQPGKTRTWWHPLLARLLDHALATAYQVLEEVLVGKLPLRLDILLIRREAGEFSELGRQDLAIATRAEITSLNWGGGEKWRTSRAVYGPSPPQAVLAPCFSTGNMGTHDPTSRPPPDLRRRDAAAKVGRRTRGSRVDSNR